ncbi:unnamed protein product [Adineta steineri]|uniref:Uncharacterized protein n=1 Tax=Adineta steineri TaxID=433720 RepID=A0A814TA82_9BILA|nr:unnamed protein product [Adineta steineri]CAF1355447.1 unnamed protein product [Adineta steineri]
MQPADYRLVRSQIQAGVMIPIKRTIYPKTIDHFFSYWLYGQKKSIEQIPVNLPRSMPCLVCSDNNNTKYEDFSLLTVDINLFLRCLPLLNNEQLSILYTLLNDDQQSYQYAIRQQYQNYKQRLLTILNRQNNM